MVWDDASGKQKIIVATQPQMSIGRRALRSLPKIKRDIESYRKPFVPGNYTSKYHHCLTMTCLSDLT